jgi:hypothetical protein
MTQLGKGGYIRGIPSKKVKIHERRAKAHDSRVVHFSSTRIIFIPYTACKHIPIALVDIIVRNFQTVFQAPKRTFYNIVDRFAASFHCM